ncbi:N-acetylmuramoyl-L-alanine amidase [Streptomyces sp. NPDC007088]|uniref:N-acetylmuramoyl-L-alanine amidase n=1 Tax=Streptomyces sp. NPDC007088 TaxID=3364773 RepID=UPI0036BF7705
MSYDYPGFPQDPPPRQRSSTVRRLATVAAVVVPAALAGWIVYGVVGPGGEDEGATDPAPSGSSSARPSPGTDGKGAPSPAGSGAGASAPAARPALSGPLSGKVVVLDPGHNNGNRLHATEIGRQVDVGNGRKECDTTGTSTDAGYAEGSFTLDVARRARALLEEQGARVTLTQDGDRPWGPCVDERARIGNAAKADAVVSVHADGAGVGQRGFHVILPAPVRAGKADTREITGPSKELGERVAGSFVRETGSAPSNYIGGGTGLDVREDLGGLNLSRVPKVFIECGNMRDPEDAALVTSAAWRQKAASGIAGGIAAFLEKS